MSNSIIGDSRSQEKGQNFGILTANDIADLKRQNKLSETGDFVFLERQDYSASTVAGGLSALTIGNSGSLDNSKYDSYFIVIHQIRQSGPYVMNIVTTLRNAGNTGGLGGPNYNCTRYDNYQGLSSNVVTSQNQDPNYCQMNSGGLHTNNDSQATMIVWLMNQGDNEQYTTWWARHPFRSNAYSGLFSASTIMCNAETITENGGWRWSGYTSSTWNCIMDVYGYKESA